MLRPQKDLEAGAKADAKKDEERVLGKTGETKECVFVVEAGERITP
jgi:hypothetical protein